MDEAKLIDKLRLIERKARKREAKVRARQTDTPDESRNSLDPEDDLFS